LVIVVFEVRRCVHDVFDADQDALISHRLVDQRLRSVDGDLARRSRLMLDD
jgi:hypothetical protein